MSEMATISQISRISRLIPDRVTQAVGRQILTTQKHSPAILFGAGAIGVVGATVLACRATLRATPILEEHKKEMIQLESLLHEQQLSETPKYDEGDLRHDKIVIRTKTTRAFIKLYGPSFILGVTSLACLAGSHRILSSRNAALTAAFTMLDQSMREYRERVRDELGEQKDKEFLLGTEIQTDVFEDKNGPKKTHKLVPAKPDNRLYEHVFDDTNPNWNPTPDFNWLYIQGQQRYANDLLRARGHVLLNDVLDALGIPRTSAGAVVGWAWGVGDSYIDFGISDPEDAERVHEFMTGRNDGLILNFNVAGNVYEMIDQVKQNRLQHNRDFINREKKERKMRRRGVTV